MGSGVRGGCVAEVKTFVEDDECDYCRGKGWYTMDGKKETCFCVDEPVSETELARMATSPSSANIQSAARELLAARKVMRAVGAVLAIQSEWEDAHGVDNSVLCNVDFDHAYWCARRDDALASVYDAMNDEVER